VVAVDATVVAVALEDSLLLLKHLQLVEITQ
jgi:hypothetical protein